ncbi:MAG TPA: fructose-6-phosphate aldolase [Aquifex aeolicus]|uniref:Probable transaldolase n=1 Tax=Aquifex aeolicus TaxID=63363 RepID=A0A9D0YQ72_AQUAO|nr:fructose-6-phosphate aldolase [Aquifex aeolicus]
MKFFLDTANIEEIKKANDLGLLDGVTTNPTLVAKTGKPFMEVAEEIINILGEGRPVSLEVVATDYEGMVRQARELSKLGPNVAVKIPMTPEGIKAVKTLSEEGIKTNVTLVFSPSQALLAAKAGATYVSPFVGRLDDISSEGIKLIEEIATIYNNYGFNTEIIVASIRHPEHVRLAALIGADIATIPFAVLEKLFKHPLTDIGLERFLKDWNSLPEDFKPDFLR